MCVFVLCVIVQDYTCVCVCVRVICMSLCANRCVSVWEDVAVGAYLHASLCVGMCRSV